MKNIIVKNRKLIEVKKPTNWKKFFNNLRSIVLLGLIYIGIIGTSIFITYLTFAEIDKYSIYERTELVEPKHILFDKELTPNADNYYYALTHYDEKKLSPEMHEIKNKIITNSSIDLMFRLDNIDYSKEWNYDPIYLNKIEYSKSITKPKIKLTFKDKYYKTNKKGERGQLAKKADLPQTEATLMLPKEDDE